MEIINDVRIRRSLRLSFNLVVIKGWKLMGLRLMKTIATMNSLRMRSTTFLLLIASLADALNTIGQFNAFFSTF